MECVQGVCGTQDGQDAGFTTGDAGAAGHDGGLQDAGQVTPDAGTRDGGAQADAAAGDAGANPGMDASQVGDGSVTLDAGPQPGRGG